MCDAILNFIESSNSTSQNFLIISIGFRFGPKIVGILPSLEHVLVLEINQLEYS